MKNKINILITYSIFKDLDIIKILKDSCNILIINKLDKLKKAINNNNIDKICIFSGIDGFNGVDTLKMIHEIDPNIQVLIWNGSYNVPHRTFKKNAIFLDTSEIKSSEIINIIKNFFKTGLN